MTDSPRAYTSEELRDALLHEVRTIATHWADPRIDRDIKGRCDGLDFSIVALLDGCSGSLPGIDLVVQPHEDDKNYHVRNGENWIEPGTVVSYMLHDHFYSRPATAADDNPADQS